jgi:biotin carboxyl carrier protein
MTPIRYDVRVGSISVAVDYDSEDGARLADATEYADIARVDDSTFSVLIAGTSYTIRIRKTGDTYTMTAGGNEASVEVESERSRLMKRAGAAVRTAEHGTSIVAPMPALVVRVETEVGQEVAAGQGVVVLEAMKMENEIRAPRAGRVKAIHANPGKAVEKGETLIILE